MNIIHIIIIKKNKKRVRLFLFYVHFSELFSLSFFWRSIDEREVEEDTHEQSPRRATRREDTTNHTGYTTLKVGRDHFHGEVTAEISLYGHGKAESEG